MLRKNHSKGGTYSRLGSSIDPALVVFNNFLAKRKTNAVPIIYITIIKALEYDKDFAGILLSEADAVIGNRDFEIMRISKRIKILLLLVKNRRFNHNPGSNGRLAEFYCIVNKVEEKLVDLKRHTLNSGEIR